MIMFAAKFVIMDECDQMRSDSDKHHRDTLMVVVRDYCANNRVPVLLATATPFGGKDTEDVQVASFLGVSTERGQIKDAIQSRMVVTRKMDVVDKDFPQLAVYCVNVEQSHVAWLSSDEYTFTEKMLKMFMQARKKNTPMDGVMLKQHEYFHDVKRYYATLYLVKECIQTIYRGQNVTRVLITSERIPWSAITRVLIEYLFGDVDYGMYMQLPGDLQKMFRQKGSKGPYMFTRSDMDGTRVPIVVNVHDSGNYNPFTGENDANATKKISSDKVAEMREKFNEGKELHVFIQGISCGSKNWNAVPTDRGHHMLHILPHGNSYLNVDLRQVVSRTNRFNSHGQCNLVSLCNGAERTDILKNVFRFFQKESSVASLLTVSSSQVQDETAINDETDKLKRDFNYPLFQSNISEWREKYFRPISKDGLSKVCFHKDGKYVEGDGIIIQDTLSVNMQKARASSLDSFYDF
jgi:hypothetical protein